MVYLAAAVWLTVVIVLAWGVRYLISSLVRPRVLNGLLLPGTILAQLGYVVALLITGVSVRNVSFVGAEEDERKDDDPPERLPMLVTTILGLLPMLFVGGALYLFVGYYGDAFAARITYARLAVEIPATWPAFWEQLRQLISLAEETLDTLRTTDWAVWKNGIAAYVLVCLTVRMAPIGGNARGHFLAIGALATLASLLGTIIPNLPEIVGTTWPALALSVGVLLVLTMGAFVVRGTVGVYRMLIY